MMHGLPTYCSTQLVMINNILLLFGRRKDRKESKVKISSDSTALLAEQAPEASQAL
jgi:hypothetical protein